MKPSMNIKHAVSLYIRGKRQRALGEIDWFRQQSSLKSAIENAALAINSESKRYSHQRRLKKEALKRARQALLMNSKAIAKSKSFDDLFSLLEAILGPISGIGELYVYDTCLRIGAKLNRLPTKVYLHAGTRVGAAALGFDGKAKTIDVSALPSEFQQLEPYEIEDVLCIFKADLKPVGAKYIKDKVTRRSWCD